MAGESTIGWLNALIDARQAIISQQTVERSPDHSSAIMRGGEAAVQIDVPVAGVDQLFLFVTGAPEAIYGAATWADARLIDEHGKEVDAGHSVPMRVMRGRHDIDKNLHSGVSGPLQIAGHRFEHGIHVYAPSKIRLDLGGKYKRFVTWIGIDDWVGDHGAVRFHVVGRRGASRLDLWEQIALDFSDGPSRHQLSWVFNDLILRKDWNPGNWTELARRFASATYRVPELGRQSRARADHVQRRQDLWPVVSAYFRSRELAVAMARLQHLNLEGLRLAIEDLMSQYGDCYPSGATYLSQLAQLRNEVDKVKSRSADRQFETMELADDLVRQFEQLQRTALLANPLLDFDSLLMIRRVPHGDPRRALGRGYGVGEYIGLPRQSSKTHPNIEQPLSWDNRIVALSPLRPDGKLDVVYQPSGNRLVTDVDLHWDGRRILFSMPGSHHDWHVFEQDLDGGEPRQLTPPDVEGIDFYDCCYLPNGQIALVSTAPLQGVPCNAGVVVGMMYVMDGDGSNIHQVCFEQDHTYCPTVLNDGRILYLRWDYTDTPHVWNRILFTMHPDGTNQQPFYGSNSYWPNAVFYARPVPQSETKFVGVVTGHHVGRVGELVLFDVAQGRHETDGVVQRIPGRGKTVKPLIEDKLTEHSWPKFLHPYPLSDHYFITACKPTPDSLWGIYLVDTFDNLVLIREEEGAALLEPIPWKSRTQPPVIQTRVVDPQADALAYIADIYSGPGLSGVPRGAVKRLRVFTYHFGYQKLAGINHRVGTDGPWEVKRVLGTVPIETDGSALFRIPAKTPISIQPLDEQGQALQLMRSWMTAMPGETLSCTGCHDGRTTTVPPRDTIALRQPPREITPWYGSVRGFSFEREVQPVLDKYCVACHDGGPGDADQGIPNLKRDQHVLWAYRHGDPELKRFVDVPVDELKQKFHGIFSPSYLALRKLVRVGGLESDLHRLPPGEFHAGTSELVQMLRHGHHGVRLSAEAWDRLITWIDLNAPAHGSWGEFVRITGDQCRRRLELRGRFGGVVEDCEQYAPPRPIDGDEVVKPIMPTTIPAVTADKPQLADWPLPAKSARQQQADLGTWRRSIDLGNDVTIDLVKIPAGRFVMGSAANRIDQQPPSVVEIRRPFWIGRCEINNRQYAQFDPRHESRFEHRTSWIFSEDYLGWPLDMPEQPVVRVSWREALAFCQWLSQRTGLRVSLPTEAEWEYACRAGSDTAFWYGDEQVDFSALANLADRSMRQLAYDGWRPRPPDLVPRDAHFDDQFLVTAPVGQYQPNPWGLCDLHGNVWEWTRSAYQAYPYVDSDGRNALEPELRRVVRGGSWYDRPARCRSSFRLDYAAWQKVFNVGFRIVVYD